MSFKKEVPYWIGFLAYEIVAVFIGILSVLLFPFVFLYRWFMFLPSVLDDTEVDIPDYTDTHTAKSRS